ncbi:MAG TPA: hypothetical protein VIX60_04365 [Candidatus Cybelea sp.]
MQVVGSISRLFTALAAGVLIAATPLDNAVILGSRPDDPNAYQIEVSSDGSASITSAAASTKSFTVPEGIVESFFAALAASSNDGGASQSCVKKAPFNATNRVKWHGRLTGDVACPARVTAEAIALNNAVLHILLLAGPPASIPRSALPPEDRPPN